MIQAAVADVIAPAVAAKDPDALLGVQVVHLPELMGQGTVEAVQVGQDFLAVFAGGLGILLVLMPALQGFPEVGGEVFFLQGFFHNHGQPGAALHIRKADAAAVFGRVLKERVAPGRTETVLVGAIRRGRRGRAPDGGAAVALATSMRSRTSA